MLIRHADIKGVLPKYCNKGMRAFFKRYGLDWSAFMSPGIPAEQLESTGDALAITAVQKVKAKWEKAAP